MLLKEQVYLGKGYIPWSKKLKQLSDLTPPDMCITKLNYSNNKLTITCDGNGLKFTDTQLAAA